MKQFCVTSSMGKRLIGRALVEHANIQSALQKGTVAIIAGTTNGYVAEEVLKSLGQEDGFSRVGFRRGMVTPPAPDIPKVEFPGDAVITNGRWDKGKTIFDVADELRAGDVVLKGANAIDPSGHAAVLIADRKGGTVLAALTAVIGRRVQLILPVGLEKRVLEDVNVLAQRINAPGSQGPRLLPVPGEVFTELDAIRLLTGSEASLIASGGVHGAEGALWLGVGGSEAETEAAAKLIKSLAGEPPCTV
jgi:hypothetical protein